MSLTTQAFAGKCGQYIFTKGVNRKYKYAPNTISQNIEKYGSSTTSEYINETLTAVTDLGVTTGTLTSTMQAFSSWGPCSTIDGGLFGQSQRRQFIEQNKEDIQLQIARGKGGHLDSLLWMYQCQNKSLLLESLRKSSDKVFENNISSKDLDLYIINKIKNEKSLSQSCRITV